MSKRLKIVFTISLLLNVLLFGALVGQKAHHIRGEDWHKQMEKMSPETRQILKDAFAQRKDRIIQAKKDVRDFMVEFEDIAMTDPFDQARYDEYVARFSEFQKHVAQKRLEMFAEVAPKLSIEEREKFSKMVSRKVIGGHFYRKDRRSDKGDARMKYMPPPKHHGDAMPPPPPPMDEPVKDDSDL